MKERVFKSWRTSLIGVLILLIGLALVITERTSWDSFVYSVPVAAAFLYVRDPARYRQR